MRVVTIMISWESTLSIENEKFMSLTYQQKIN